MQEAQQSRGELTAKLPPHTFLSFTNLKVGGGVGKDIRQQTTTADYKVQILWSLRVESTAKKVNYKKCQRGRYAAKEMLFWSYLGGECGDKARNMSCNLKLKM